MPTNNNVFTFRLPGIGSIEQIPESLYLEDDEYYLNYDDIKHIMISHNIFSTLTTDAIASLKFTVEDDVSMPTVSDLLAFLEGNR